MAVTRWIPGKRHGSGGWTLLGEAGNLEGGEGRDRIWPLGHRCVADQSEPHGALASGS